VGIAQLACFLGDGFPDVIRVWPREPPTRRTAWLILHEDMRRSARIRAVSAAIAEAFRHQRNTLADGIRSKSGPH
jgi:DNA-binding transcriptional LysR family regulator